VEHRLHAGAIAVIPPDHAHSSHVDRDQGALRRCIHFDWRDSSQDDPPAIQVWADERPAASEVHAVPVAIRRRLPVVAQDLPPVVIEQLDRCLIQAGQDRGLASALLWPVLRVLLQQTTAASGGLPRSAIVDAVLDCKRWIEQHLPAELSIDAHARRGGYSRNHFAAAFSRLVGMPPLAYQHAVLLAEARRRLQVGPEPVATIAAAVGFPDGNYFARLYRRRFGHPPSAERSAGR
jgi:AraC-like DNA-binding protein